MTSLLDRLVAEQRLLRAGVGPRSARRLGGWAAQIGVGLGPGTLAEQVQQVDLAALSPEALHALGILLTELLPHQPERSSMSVLLSIDRELGRRRAYLDDLAERAGLSPSRRAAAYDAAGHRGARLLGHLAQGTLHPTDARELEVARTAIAALRDAAAVQAAPAIASHTLRGLLAASLQRIEARLAAVAAQDDAPVQAWVETFEAACSEDERLGGEGEVQAYVVSAWLPVAWRSYTARQWVDLRALLGAIDAIVDSLAAQLEGNPSELAYRAAVGQALVFRSEMAVTLSEQILIGERALAICPSLRNARVVLASHLATRAARDPDPLVRQRDARRALELDPHQRTARKILTG